MKHNIIVKFNVIDINSNEAIEKVKNELGRKEIQLNDWVILNTEKIREYKVHEIYVCFKVEAKNMKEADLIVTDELSRQSLRRWGISKVEQKTAYAIPC